MSLPLPGEEYAGPTFGELIYSIRARRGLSTRQAARRAESAGHSLSASSFVKIEHGARNNPNLQTLQALADTLDVEIEIRPGRPMRVTDLSRQR